MLKKSKGTKESPHRLARENAMTKRMEALTAESAEETIAATTRDFPPNLEPGNTAAYKKTTNDNNNDYGHHQHNPSG